MDLFMLQDSTNTKLAHHVFRKSLVS